MASLSFLDENSLNFYSITKVDFATADNQLQALRFAYSDGTRSAVFGSPEAVFFKSYEFGGAAVTSVGVLTDGDVIRQISFYGEARLLLRCGSVGQENQNLQIPNGQRILAAFGSAGPAGITGLGFVLKTR